MICRLILTIILKFICYQIHILIVPIEPQYPGNTLILKQIVYNALPS